MVRIAFLKKTQEYCLLQRASKTIWGFMKMEGPVILVDDDIEDRELVIEALTELKINNEVRSFSNGREVIDYLLVTKEQPFIIFSDVNMPVMDGLVLRKTINSNEVLRQKSIPFVYLTTSSNSIIMKKAYGLTVQGFFQKPVRFNDLCEMLKLIFVYWEVCKHPSNTD